MKICNKCNKTKFYEEYHKCGVAKDGYNYTCKECLNAINREYIKKRVEKDPLYEYKRYKKYRANVDPETSSYYLIKSYLQI